MTRLTFKRLQKEKSRSLQDKCNDFGRSMSHQTLKRLQILIVGGKNLKPKQLTYIAIEKSRSLQDGCKDFARSMSHQTLKRLQSLIVGRKNQKYKSIEIRIKLFSNNIAFWISVENLTCQGSVVICDQQNFNVISEKKMQFLTIFCDFL